MSDISIDTEKPLDKGAYLIQYDNYNNTFDKITANIMLNGEKLKQSL